MSNEPRNDMERVFGRPVARATAEDSLSRRLSDAYARRRNAETDNEWNALDRLVTELLAELESSAINDTLAASADAIARTERLAGLS